MEKMPNKYAKKKGQKVPKQRYKITNWNEYNQSLRKRGDIEFWISDEVLEMWYEPERVYDGTEAPKKFSDFAITIGSVLYLDILNRACFVSN